MLLRVLIFAAIGLLIYFGIRRIWRDWTNKFNHDAEEAKRIARERDRAERAKPGVIDLKRGEDGTYRPRDGNDADNRH